MNERNSKLDINTIYFGQLPSDEGGDTFIAIEHGATGYSDTTIYDQAHCDVMNERQGVTKADFEAAITCSMAGNWIKFYTLSSRLASK